MAGIVKRFGAHLALDQVDFDLRAGEIHAVLGENGAGKSTLMNVLYGLIQPDAGTIHIAGRPMRHRSPREAMDAGIGMVHQHFMLVPGLSVAENLVLGEAASRSGRRRGFLLSRRDLESRARALSVEYGLDVLPDRPVETLSVGQQQRVEILKALYRNAHALILDEPTAVLTPQEFEGLAFILERLRDEGRAIVFITHKLHEVKRLADRVTVLRRGRVAGSLSAAEVEERQLAEMMVGRQTRVFTPGSPVSVDVPAVLEVAGLVVEGDRREMAVRGADFVVRRGEILGIAGVTGNGQTELAEALVGTRRVRAGTIRLAGRPLTRSDPATRQRAGLAHIPEDRREDGLVLEFSVAENLALKHYRVCPFSRFGVLCPTAIGEHARRLVEDYQIRTPDAASPVMTLSGGNQQKVVIARELAAEPVALIAVNPTRGLDIGAAEFVHDTFLRARMRGLAIVLISNELEEILALADRIAVMSGGRLREVPADRRDHEAIGRLMLGGEGGGAHGAAVA